LQTRNHRFSGAACFTGLSMVRTSSWLSVLLIAMVCIFDQNEWGGQWSRCYDVLPEPPSILWELPKGQASDVSSDH
jgi:hypothetical protein